jgi:hypothetical protein
MVRPFTTRAAAIGLSAALVLGSVGTAPCAAAEPAQAGNIRPLTRLSAASRAVLARSTSPAQAPTQAPSSGSSFFKSRRGATVLALMGAGVGFTVWSAHHDRQTVKSPVR